MLGTAEVEKNIRAEQGLSQKLQAYAGRWVVIYCHEVVASGKTPAEALEKAPDKFDRILRVAPTAGAALL